MSERTKYEEEPSGQSIAEMWKEKKEQAFDAPHVLYECCLQKEVKATLGELNLLQLEWD